MKKYGFYVLTGKNNQNQFSLRIECSDSLAYYARFILKVVDLFYPKYVSENIVESVYNRLEKEEIRSCENAK